MTLPGLVFVAPCPACAHPAEWTTRRGTDATPTYTIDCACERGRERVP